MLRRSVQTSLNHGGVVGDMKLEKVEEAAEQFLRQASASPISGR